MKELSESQFRANMKIYVDQSVADHEPIRVRRRDGKDFIVLSAEDWEKEQETLYVFNNSSLMKQIAESVNLDKTTNGYTPSKEEIDANNRL
jgi:antitoxin YefM